MDDAHAPSPPERTEGADAEAGSCPVLGRQAEDTSSPSSPPNGTIESESKRPEDALNSVNAAGDAETGQLVPLPPAPSAHAPATTSGALATVNPRESHQLSSLSPMNRRIVVATGKAGLSIANGILLSRSAILNPVVSAALVAYESMRAIVDYHNGAPNTLGYRTGKADLAMRLGKEVGMFGIGMGIGQGIGALVGLSAIPVAGQIVLATVLSVGVGICVGTLLTRYVDRLFVRWQIRHQYGYPADEKGARRRFEQLLEERHDLSSLDTCKVVQHYADYRVASGWESPNDVDDYRLTGDIRQMPVSFQHFAVVLLQRKWGFLNDHKVCKKVFKVLMLQHHPDRGGNTEMAALLNRDYEVYAYCHGWDEDCPNLLHPDGDPLAPSSAGATDQQGRPKRRNVVVDFFRSIFRQATNSDIEASDLHQFGLRTLEAGTRTELHRLDSLKGLGDEDAGENDDNEPLDSVEGQAGASASRAEASGTSKQRAIARVLAALQHTYQVTSETITFSGLVRASEDKEKWAELREEVFMFNRMQCFVHVSQSAAGDAHSLGTAPHECHRFRWTSTSEAIERRETARERIIASVFSRETSEQLETAVHLWQTARALAENYFKQCAAEREQEARAATLPSAHVGEGDGTGQTLETLMNVQRKMEALSASVKKMWGSQESEWATRSLKGFSNVIDDLREVGLTASFALAGEHAKTLVSSRKDDCETYFSAWMRKRRTTCTLLHELRLAKTQRQSVEKAWDDGTLSEDGKAAQLEELQQHTSNFTLQLVLLQQQQAEMDAKVAELTEMCTVHFPEGMDLLKGLPSTCARCLDETRGPETCPRRLPYERERTLMSYQRVELEPANRMVPPADLKETFPSDCVRNSLFKALYTDVATGTVSSCWLKSYSFPERDDSPATTLEDIDGDTEDDDDDNNNGDEGNYAIGGNVSPDREKCRRVSRRRSLQSAFLEHILAGELVISEGCSSKYVLAPTDVLCDPEKRRVFFHLPRGATQQRFGSVVDIKRRIRPLGLRWLLDALQCLIDLHSCQLAHGRVSLSNFTYDEFGNTALGFFDCVRRLDCLRNSMEDLLAVEVAKDVIDFGAMIISEVLPYLGRPGALVSPTSSQAPSGFPVGDEEQNMTRVFKEVGERLIGKENPRWTLLQARTFVRRCLQFNYESDENDFTFSKEVSFPPYWGPIRPLVPQFVLRDTRVKWNGMSADAGREHRTTVFLSVNASLWEMYWSCRRAMSLTHKGTFTSPATFQTAPSVLPCSDDCEVNERFMWYPCASEEDAWKLCQSGFPRSRPRSGTVDDDNPYSDSCLLHFSVDHAPCAGGSNSSTSTVWGVMCRTAVGTVVSGSANPSFVAPPPELDSSANDRITYAARRRCHITPQEENSLALQWLLVPAPWARCYPEYVVRISADTAAT